MQTLPALIIEWVLIVFMAVAGAIILGKMLRGTIDLSGLLSEPPTVPVGAPPGTPPLPGKASMSRLQLLLFTFVIVGLFLTLSFKAGEMVAIPNQVLGLLGISGGSYVVSKGIQLNKQPDKSTA